MALSTTDSRALIGEPYARPLKGTCETCLYACTFAGRKEEDLPEWLQKTEMDLA